MSPEATFRRKLRRAGALLALLAGAAIGLAHGLPVEDVQAAGKCPPAGEGLHMCIVQKSWMPAVMEVLLLGAGMYLLYEFLIGSPRMWRTFRDERRLRKEAALPPFETDRTLLAATWGNKYDDPAHPRPRRVVGGPIPVPAAATHGLPVERGRDDPDRQRRLARIALALDLAEQLGSESKSRGRDSRAA